MGQFIKGDIIVVPFPFSDLSDTKSRPAFVLKPLKGGDYILCQITKIYHSDPNCITIKNNDFDSGSLPQPVSYIKVDHLFTCSAKIITRKRGTLSQLKIDEIINKLVSFIQS